MLNSTLFGVSTTSNSSLPARFSGASSIWPQPPSLLSFKAAGPAHLPHRPSQPLVHAPQVCPAEQLPSPSPNSPPLPPHQAQSLRILQPCSLTFDYFLTFWQFLNWYIFFLSPCWWWVHCKYSLNIHSMTNKFSSDLKILITM